ncbi:MAG: hypothetical protein ACLS3V_05550 [Streptococcus sp.]
MSVITFLGEYCDLSRTCGQALPFVKEEEVLDHVKKATGRAFRFWVIVQNLIFILVIPLFLALGLPVWGVILVAVAMAILKYVIFRKRLNLFISSLD